MADVRREIAASKAKLAAQSKKQQGPDAPPGPELRKSPAGRRLASLRKRHGKAP